MRRVYASEVGSAARTPIMGHKPLFLIAFLIGLAPAAAVASPDPEALDSPKFHALLALGVHYPGRRPVGKPIKRLQELEPGDLVFYNTRNSPYSHVGIYVGDGRFVHAPRSGQRVRAESVDSPYWRARFDGARRVGRPD